MRRTRTLKRLIVLLAVFMIVSLFGGCAQSDDTISSDTNTSSDETVTETETNASEDEDVTTVEDGPFVPFEETVTITIGKYDSFQFYGEDDDYISAEDNIWIKNIEEALNVKFEFEWITTDSDTALVKWNTAIASNNLPDMGIVDGALYESLIDAGMIADMTEEFDSLASDKLKELFSGSTEEDYMMADGTLYGLPMMNATPQRFHMLFLRQDWLDQVGMEVPTTIDELIEVATAFTEAELGGEDTYGLAVGGTPDYVYGSLEGFFEGYGIPYGVWAEAEDGSVYYGSVDDRMEEALLQLQEMYANGLLRQDYTVADVTESVTAGEVGMFYGVCYAPVITVDLYQIDEEVDFIAAELPTVDGSEATYYDSAAPDTFVFVNADFEYPEAAVKVINQIVYNLNDLSYDWGYIRNASPIGGVTYEQPFSWSIYYQEIEYAYETGDTSQFTTANSEIYYNRLIGFEEGDRTLGKYYPIYRVDVGGYAILNNIVESGRVENTLFLGTQTETMVEREALLTDLLNTAINKVVMGADISVWTEAVEEWYSTGGQTITDEVTAWYNEQ